MALKLEHTLLLVDDEKAITRALNRLFRKEGYQILTADSGSEGLEILQQNNKQVSMIISDQRMPVMNGAQFLEKAKTICPEAIRYLLTGYSDMEAVIQAVNKGEIHRYLTKPWNDEDLVLQVRLSLEHYELIADNLRLTELTAAQSRRAHPSNPRSEQAFGRSEPHAGSQFHGLDPASGFSCGDLEPQTRRTDATGRPTGAQGR